MVLKSLVTSTIEEGEEEDVYLRKCNIRKSRRQNEKSRKVAIQINEQLSLEKVQSPVPLPSTRSNTATSKSPARKERVLQSPFFPSKSRTNSTDDVYPAPSPPPRSPSFGSPVALSRTLALSLSLFSPGGFTISGSGRKPSISSIRSPEGALHNNGINYDNNYAGIQRAPSNDSTCSWGEIVELSSPGHSPRSPVNVTSANNNADSRVTPTRSQDEEYYRDGEHNAHLRDSNRVKQFLFHRDRNRARKAQLLYPSGTYGNSCEFSPDLDEYKHPNQRTPDSKIRDRKVSSPVNTHSGQKSRRNSGSFGHNQSGKNNRKYSDVNLKVDVETDQRSGSIGSVGTTPYSLHRASFRVDSPSTPYAANPSTGEGYGNSAAEDSPYYRAVTLGARNSPTVHNNSALSMHSRKDGRTNSVSSVGSSGSEQSVHTIHSIAQSPSTSPVFPATHMPIATSDTYVRRRRDSITSPDSPSSNDRSVEIYETLFPALPVPAMQKTASNMGSILEKVKNIEPAITSAPASPATVMVVPDAVPSVPVVPAVPVYSSEQLCTMFHTALVHTGLRANNMPISTPAIVATKTIADTNAANTTRYRVLYVLYKSSHISNSTEDRSEPIANSHSMESVSIRAKIAEAIDHTTSERYQRCKQLLHTATASEMDVNFISKSGYSELVTSHGNSKHNAVGKCPVVEVATVCDISAVIQAENERSAYKTKDSEVSIIELIKYIIAHEVTELLVQQQLSESRVSSPVRSSEQSRTQFQEDLLHMKQRNTESRNVLLSLTRAYCSLFRCYTYKLGAHYAGSSDSVEQPVLLEYLMQILDGLLAWAKVLTSCIDMCDNSITRVTSSPGRTKKSPKSVTKYTNASDNDKTVLEEVCECILQNAYKYWTTKLNYAQDIAFLLQCENVLTIYTPSRSSNLNTSAILSYSAIFASTNRTDTATKATLPPLLTKLNTTSTSTGCIVQKILYKMLSRVCSQHVKVATQAMQSIQSPIIMVRYFLPRMTTAMVTYIFGTEVGRVTFMTGPGWENSRREDCLNLLVDKLRECRNVYLNFSTQLQISSTQLLDTTLELLQVIEDAE